jgi:hypothetical protein
METIRSSQRLVCTALAAVVVLSMASAFLYFPAPAQAVDTLVYSFEPDLEGFGPNPAGNFPVTQDTIGATDGAHSMKVELTGQTFVGALTENLHPAIGDPPGLDHVTFDLTLTEAFPEGGFAVVGVMIFAVTQEGTDVQLQTGPSIDPALEFHIDGLEAGTYPDVTIDMTQFFHPVTFEPGTFNDIVGTQGSGPNDIIPTGFQLYFNKTGGLDFPLTVYIDKIRVGMTPEGIPGDHNGDGTVDAADYALWRSDPDSYSGDPQGYIDWVDNFGATAGSGGSVITTVAEPSGALMLVWAGACWWTVKRRRANL